jgi:O-antigen/teichoic acid export membrane protein
MSVQPPIAPDVVEPTDGRFALGGRSLRAHAARGTIINGVFLVGVDSLTVIKGFVVAGLLSTGDYGIWGILVVALGTLGWLKQVGVSDKYIQQDEADQEAAFQKAFSLEAIFTLSLMGLMLLLLPVYAIVYRQHQILAAGAVATLVMPALILQAPVWVFYRRMDFRRQRTLQAIDPIVSFVVTVALAIAGAGYWALVVGLVAGSWSGAAVAVAASPYRLRFRYERGTTREYLSFSWPLAAAALGATALSQGSLIAGEYAVGIAGVGALTLAASIAIYTQRLDAIISETLYPAICAVQDRADLLMETFVKSNRLAMMWGVPFGTGLALFASDLVHKGIGDKWVPAIGLIQAFGLIAALDQVGFNWDDYFRARGDTRPVAVVSLLTLIPFGAVAVPLLFAHGLNGFAVGMGFIAAFSILMRFVFLRRLFPAFSFARQALRAITPTLPAAGAVLLARVLETGERTAAMALAELAGYLLITAATTWAFERELLREMAGYLRDRGDLQASAA